MIHGSDLVPRAVAVLMQRWHLDRDGAQAAFADLVEGTGASQDDLARLIVEQTVPERSQGLAGLHPRVARTGLLVGQATGLLMAQQGIGAEQAYEELARLAQERGRGVRDVAHDLVRRHGMAPATDAERETARPDVPPPARRPVPLRTGVLYERYYSAAPAQVVAALVRTLAQRGRLERVEGHGREVVFVTTRDSWARTCLLRAWVNGWHAGALLQVEAIDPGVLSEEEDAEEVGRLMEILGLVGEGSLGRLPRT